MPGFLNQTRIMLQEIEGKLGVGSWELEEKP
jgi:hypothetical protein